MGKILAQSELAKMDDLIPDRKISKVFASKGSTQSMDIKPMMIYRDPMVHTDQIDAEHNAPRVP